MLSPEVYLQLLGVTGLGSSAEVSKRLKDMMLASIGPSMVNQEVEVLGTVETQDLSLQVSIKVLVDQEKL